MDISIILVEKEQTSIAKFINECTNSIKKLVDNFEFIVVSNDKIRSSAKYLGLQTEESDFKRMVMCGVDNSQYDTVIIANSTYSPSVIVEMIKKHKDGAEIVCVRKKQSKIKKFFSAISLAYYNLILRVLGREFFSMGIYQDLQLISGEALTLMKANQPYAHRMRTMYVPNAYETEYLECESAPKLEYVSKNGVFYASIIASILLLLCFICGLIICAVSNANFVPYFLVILGFLLLEFVSSFLVADSIAKVQIGGLYEPYSNGKIYKVRVKN